MKKPYQIESARAVQRFQKMAGEEMPPVQLMMPMAEIASMIQRGAGELMREAGVLMMHAVMEAEVQKLVGDRHQQGEERQGHRWGRERGYCLVDGQKVPINRTRVRGKNKREIRLGSYELFQRNQPLEGGVWWKMMCGLSTRNYGQVTKTFEEAYGVEKSAVSDQFIESSREKLKELMERRLGDLNLVAVLIDGTPFKGRQMMAALGVSADGQKTVLGLREGATENAAVTGELLSDLMERGVDFTVPRLYVLDGGKALTAAVRRHAGDAAFIQRCQVHKRRNVLDHLPEQHQPSAERKLNAAYAMVGYKEASDALGKLVRELMEINPSAARSLEEGMEETLTMHKLAVPEALRKSLASTNIIESAFSVVETACQRVKRWREGDHRERWLASALLTAESKFRRIKGYREIPRLIDSLAKMHVNNSAKKCLAKNKEVA